MRNIKCILFILMSVMIITSCDDRFTNIDFSGYTGTPKTIEASEISYDSLPGAIKLKLACSKEERYEYIKCSYINPANNKTVTKIISKYCDSLVINNTLKKYGTYTFNIQPYNAQNKGGAITKINAMSGRALATITKKETKVI